MPSGESKLRGKKAVKLVLTVAGTLGLALVARTAVAEFKSLLPSIASNRSHGRCRRSRIYRARRKSKRKATMSIAPSEVETYKISQYERLGFSFEDALMAIDQRIDWHDAERLLSRGCSPELALAILAPLP